MSVLIEPKNSFSSKREEKQKIKIKRLSNETAKVVVATVKVVVVVLVAVVVAGTVVVDVVVMFLLSLLLPLLLVLWQLLLLLMLCRKFLLLLLAIYFCVTDRVLSTFLDLFSQIKIKLSNNTRSISMHNS